MRSFISVVVFVLSFAACGNVETYTSGPSGSTSSQSPITSPQPIGGRCVDDGDCQGSAICADVWPNGYCTQLCGTSSRGACPSSSTCVSTSDTNAFCMSNCTTDSTCRPGYECAKLKSGGGACMPKS